jgi:hypothetical protein
MGNNQRRRRRGMNQFAVRKGDIVMIYEDPITKEKPEGNATLIKKLFSTMEGTNWHTEYWQVRFINEEAIFERTIRVDHN